MKMRVIQHLIVLVLTTFVLHSESKSLNVCPDENDEEILLTVQTVDVPAVERTSLIRRIRLPPQGLYDQTINCFMVSDTSLDDRGGEVEVTGGGLNHRFLELRLVSEIGKDLDFVIEVYSSRSRISANANSTQESL